MCVATEDRDSRERGQGSHGGRTDGPICHFVSTLLRNGALVESPH